MPRALRWPLITGATRYYRYEMRWTRAWSLMVTGARFILRCSAPGQVTISTLIRSSHEEQIFDAEKHCGGRRTRGRCFGFGTRRRQQHEHVDRRFVCVLQRREGPFLREGPAQLLAMSIT